ncbi:MAG: ParB N-terminal domain-containing protein, partial [Euryarchaeota archaeon]
MWDEDDVQLVPLEWLKPHEEIKPRNRDKLLEMTKRWGGYTKPLIVDKVTGAILDGHHRYSIAIELGLAQIPVIAVDYLNDESIEVDVWPSAEMETLTKQQVIEMSLSVDVFPPKTSRHRIADHLPPIHVPLEILAKPA